MLKQRKFDMTINTGLIKFEYKNNEIDWTGFYISNKDISKYITLFNDIKDFISNPYKYDELCELISILELCNKNDNDAIKLKSTKYIKTKDI